MKEIWKDIVGYEGVYKISNTQKISSIDRVITVYDPRWKKNKSIKYTGRQLKFILDSDGYYQVSLCNHGTQKEFKVHRLMAIHFIPFVEGKEQINHKNGIKIDNRVENLEWCTTAENSTHAKANGLLNPPRGKNHWASGKKGMANSAILLDTQTGIFYDSFRDASFAKNIPLKSLYKKLQGQRANNTSLIYA